MLIMEIMGITGLITEAVIDAFSFKTSIGTTRILVSIMWAAIAICGAIRGIKK